MTAAGVRRSLGVVSGALVFAIAIAAQSELVIQKEGTDVYHRPSCAVIRDGVGVLALSKAQADARGLKAHPDCDPAKAVPSAEAAAREPAKPASAIVVFTDESKYYHRESCRRLRGESKRTHLEAAGKTRWPCPACRPPIRPRNAPAIPKRFDLR
jgi:hypothetical protein